MPSVADQLRRALRLKTLAASPDERVALTAHLAAADMDLYCAAHGTSRETARRVFVQRRQSGRRHSRVMQETRE